MSKNSDVFKEIRDFQQDKLGSFKALSELFSLIPLNGKSPCESNWQRWCRDKKPFDPDNFRGKNAGICCGKASGVLVLDEDHRGKLQHFLDEHGYFLPDTRTHQTGTGGRHFLYKYPDNGTRYGNRSYQDPDKEKDPKTGKVITVFDVRGDGGQVVAPGSIHPDTGKPYIVLHDHPIVPAPKWLLEFAKEEAQKPKREAPTIGTNDLFQWDGDIDHLPGKPETIALIMNGRDKGERSNAIMSVLNLLVFANLSDSQIIEIFESYPEGIGAKYFETGRTRERWLIKQIEKARRNNAERAKAPYKRPDKPIKQTRPIKPVRETESRQAREEEPQEGVRWEFASELFPRVPFPWHTLPVNLSDSLKQLARSCASTDNHLPGCVFCILGGAVGKMANIKLKESWKEPFIFWFCDIRDSGTAKTPTQDALMNVLYRKQKEAWVQYMDAKQAYDALSKKRKEDRKEPPKARPFFVSNMTIEGIRRDLEGHPTGGLVVAQDELSSFITSQNQYKSKGDDREAWLSLWNGKPTRVARAKEDLFLEESRVSIFGGMQPIIFNRVFRSEDGLYLMDGTIFRFLFTSAPPVHIDLTLEAWLEDYQKDWFNLVERALYWTDEREEPFNMIVNMEAREFFTDWRNNQNIEKEELPHGLRGFLPKAYSYALRLSGILHCLHAFHSNTEPRRVLGIEDIQRGIEVANFYLGQAVDAVNIIENPFHNPTEVSEKSIHLADTLEALKDKIDSGRLAVSFVHESFNENAPETMRFKSARAIGAYLRSIGLTIPNAKQNANGKRGIRCLEWDEKIEIFLNKVRQVRLVRFPLNHAGLSSADKVRQSPPKSAFYDTRADLADFEKPKSAPANVDVAREADKADLADFVLEKNEKTLECSKCPHYDFAGNFHLCMWGGASKNITSLDACPMEAEGV